jgi:hypothetical protein
MALPCSASDLRFVEDHPEEPPSIFYVADVLLWADWIAECEQTDVD